MHFSVWYLYVTPQVLDPRTRMILFKMLSRGVFSEINGCISTGKEASLSEWNKMMYCIIWYTCVIVSLSVILPRTNANGVVFLCHSFFFNFEMQANVYHATTVKGESRAIKIYKTSILLFKDRDKYVSGEFRWDIFFFRPLVLFSCLDVCHWKVNFYV